ncbi:MAG UNVERIFIED_CONTAM: hypothetical protein LVR18_33780 [Planctomycetaceae bacterium]
MTTAGAEFQDRVQSWIGTALMIAASILAVLIFCDRTGFSAIDMPRIWHASRGIHLLLCGDVSDCCDAAEISCSRQTCRTSGPTTL